MIEKENYYRDRNLLAMAKGEMCLMRVPNVCRIDPATTVSAHSNMAKHGKGKGIKAHDAYSVWACARCHTWLDQSYSATKEQKDAAFNVGHNRQIVAWRAIAENLAAKPEKVKAAKLALEFLKSRGDVA